MIQQPILIEFLEKVTPFPRHMRLISNINSYALKYFQLIVPQFSLMWGLFVYNI